MSSTEFILSRFKDGKQYSPKGLIAETGMSDATVKGALERLCDRRLITRVETGVYELAKGGKTIFDVWTVPKPNFTGHARMVRLLADTDD